MYSYDPQAANLESRTIRLKNVTFMSNQVDSGACDPYHGGGPFTAKSGCRCRFDCVGRVARLGMLTWGSPR